MKLSRLFVPATVLSLVASAAVGVLPTQATEKATPKQAEAIAERLGASRSAGSYYDAKTGNSVVNVTDAAAAAEVRDAGATPRVVSRSGARLAAVKRALDTNRLVPGSSWAVDVRTNTVNVSVDSSVVGTKMSKVRSAVAKYGADVRVTRMAGSLRPFLSGGDKIRFYDSNGTERWCSVGFNVVYNDDTSKHALLTAGHCGEAHKRWLDSDDKLAAKVTEYSFPDNDYAIFDYVDGYGSHPSAVGNNQDITSAGEASVGQQVSRRGATTGTHSGTVRATDVTVHYVSGDTVRGMTETNVCSEPGDSGGSFYNGKTAYGLLSGGSGNCTTGGRSYYQPVKEVLRVYDVKLG